MSRTTVYRCDLCGSETTKISEVATEWSLDADVFTRFGKRSECEVMHQNHIDICPRCMERIALAFGDAWKRAKDGAR